MAKELRNPPSLGVTSISYNPFISESTRPNLLAAGSWDRKVRLYDTDSNSLQMIEDYPGGPVLDCIFLSDTTGCINGGNPGGSGTFKLAAGGVGRELVLYDLVTGGQNTSIGIHDDAIKCVRFHSKSGLLYTCGWDGFVKCWDERCKPKESVASTKLYGKAFGMDLTDDHLVLVDSWKQTYIFDIRHPGFNKLESRRDHILKYQLRCVKCFPKGTGFAVSSVEGRVAWEYFSEDPDLQASKYAFKCHRTKTDEGEKVFPVHALAFHPQFGTFATGGGDGGVSVWDGYNKKRLWRLPPLDTSIASLSFNSTGTQLAVAVSYMYDEGPKSPMPTTQIIVRQVNPDDVRPKQSHSG